MDAVLGDRSGRLLYYKNTGTSLAPQFLLQTGADDPFGGIDIGLNSAPSFVDIDGDGDMDCFSGDSYGGFFFFKKTGISAAPIFTLQTGNLNPLNGIDLYFNSKPAFTDLDGDGDMDLITGENPYYTDNIRYFKNTGTALAAEFTEQTGTLNPFNGVILAYATPAFVDIDNDGDQDLFFGDYNGGMSYYKNTCANPTSGGTISAAQTICSGSTPVALASVTLPTGQTGTLQYQWQSSTDGISFSNLATGTFTATTYSPGSLTATTWYKRLAKVNCESTWKESNSVIITVNVLPVPAITGPASACATSTGNIYTTAAGMTGYTWTVSAGGSIMAGATTNAITVTWNTAGAQTVSVNYTNANNCTTAAATVYDVTVNPLPVPVITGPASACATSTGNAYSTAAGMTGYTWTVSAGGAITAGATTNAITVTWNTTGAQSVSVNYTDANNCTTAAATVYNVTVNPFPVVPVITGPAIICLNSGSQHYLTTQGMTGYTWTVSAGGTIAAGATTFAIYVTWNTAGAQTVSVNYSNGNSCTAATATVYDVTVNPLPVPVITGPASACVTSTGNVYSTAAGMTGYTWTVSAGGTITAGTTTNTITVTWNTAGAQTVSVNYTDGNSCTAAAATVYDVTVNPLPVPVITGPVSACVTSTGNVYSTATGMTAYAWTVSAGGSITAGTTTNTITFTWNTAGAQTVSVNYTNGNSCTAAAATVYNVTVNTLPVAPVITGPASACVTSTGNEYSTAAGMTAYTWTVSAGGTITAGATTNTITVTWNTAGAQTVSVNYSNGNSCTAATATVYDVTVNPLPVPVITGPASECVTSTGNVYSTAAGMTAYDWIVSAGGTITAGTTTNTITVTWNTAGAQSVSVNYTNGNSCTAATATVYDVTVNPLFTAGSIKKSGETICYNGDPAQIGDSISANGGDASTTYQWQSSPNSGFTGTPTDIATNEASYTPPANLTATTWYRRQAKDGLCNTTFTSSSGVWKVSIETTAPVALAKNITIYLNAAGSATLAAADIDNGSTDNCSIATRVASKTTFACSDKGANTVILTVTDAAGNSATASSTVTVEDAINPVAVAKNITATLNAQGTVSIAAADINNGSSDNCSFALSASKTTFNCSNLGPNTVILTVTDASGNTATANSVVTVVEGTDLPSPWQKTLIGNSSGTAAFSPCTVPARYTLTSKGYTVPNNDVQEFVYQTLNGNGYIVARIVDLTNNGWAAVQIRENLTPGSKKVLLKAQLQTMIRSEVRQTQGGSHNSNQVLRQGVKWLKIVRVGNRFDTYSSENGISWRSVFSTVVSMSTSVLIGVSSESMNNTTTTRARFDNVSVIASGGAKTAETEITTGGNEKQIDIYPNPARDMVTVVYPYAGIPVTLTLFSANGSAVKTTTLINNETQVDVSSLLPGVYILRFRSAEAVNVKRLVIQ